MHINKTMIFALFFSEIEEKKLFFVFIIRSVADSKIWPRSSQGKTILILEMLRQSYLHFKWAKTLIFSTNTQNIMYQIVIFLKFGFLCVRHRCP